MNYRVLGKTGWRVSEVSVGAWQIGGGWGQPFDEQAALKTLHTAIDQGINFIDTADVYDGGQSESAVGKLLKQRKENIYVATKCGRFLNPHVSEGYTGENLERFVENSLKNLGTEAIDLLQLHCPPTDVYYRPEVFETLDRLVRQGKIRHYGVSVEKVEEALKAIAYPNVATVQIIFNMFRLRPRELFFSEALKHNVGVIVRVPLASGLLSGKFNRETAFSAGDHRQFNRQGEAFDKGETFSGVDYETGLKAADALKHAMHRYDSLAQAALRFILEHDAVSCIIPGASKPEQAVANAAVSELSHMTNEELQQVEHIYNDCIKPLVHHLW